jgi:hypothetical protein
MTSVLIGYPTGWTLAVIDDEAAATRAADALREAGARPDDVLVIAGADAPRQLRRLGASTGLLARARRAVQFMAMDQLPDLFVYEAALEQGRAVVAVRVPADRRPAVVDVLRRHRAHFINSFGAWMTSEIEPWHGTMPPMPQHMQR